MQERPSKNLAEYRGEDQVISSHEMALRWKDTPESLIQVKSMIPSLDDALAGGFRDGELYGVSGPTKGGKTLLCQTLTRNFEKQQYHSLWFTYEVPVRQFLSQFPQMPMTYLPAKLKAHALPWVEDRIQESFLKYHTRIIFLDHLHYLFDLAKTRNPSIEIGQVIRRLKTMAVDGGFIVFLLCHTKMGASETNLSYESIRDSSFVSQESDSVFMIKRTPDVNTNAARLRVEFHRRTGCLERVIELQKTDGLLVERTAKEEPRRRDLE
jgi:predicted ATP-dependent serine protease